jgi:hypothetical protein
MTHFGITPLANRLGTAVTWLAVLALLSHALMLPALTAAVGSLNPSVDTVKSTLCSAGQEGNARGKAKPGPPAHYCALCTVPAVDLYHPRAGQEPTPAIALAAYPRLRAEWLALPPRHRQVQARAPPTMA